MKNEFIRHRVKYLRIYVVILFFLFNGVLSFSADISDTGGYETADDPVADDAGGNGTAGDTTVKKERDTVASSDDTAPGGSKVSYRISGFAQLWYVYEQNENDKQQSYTADPAVDETAGFSINKARLTFEAGDESLSLRLTAGFDSGGTPLLLDCFGSWKVINEYLVLYAGQLKIPSAWETSVNDSELDFITRARFSSETPNWSLCKSPSSVSPFTSVETNMRDAGMAIKGSSHGFSYFLMVSNGLGANLFIGGSEKKGYIYANRFGAYFYGMRLEYDAASLFSKSDFLAFINRASVGAHYNYNIHDNIIYNDTRTVLDLRRKSYSVDLQLAFFKRVRITAMYGRGLVEDDYDYDGDPDLEYSGWETRIMWEIMDDLLEAGIRYDEYRTEKTVYGSPDTLQVITAGLNLYPYKGLKLQLNYKLKNNESELKNDTDDDCLVFQLQYGFQLK